MWVSETVFRGCGLSCTEDASDAIRKTVTQTEANESGSRNNTTDSIAIISDNIGPIPAVALVNYDSPCNSSCGNRIGYERKHERNLHFLLVFRSRWPTVRYPVTLLFFFFFFFTYSNNINIFNWTLLNWTARGWTTLNHRYFSWAVAVTMASALCYNSLLWYFSFLCVAHMSATFHLPTSPSFGNERRQQQNEQWQQKQKTPICLAVSRLSWQRLLKLLSSSSTTPPPPPSKSFQRTSENEQSIASAESAAPSELVPRP